MVLPDDLRALMEERLASGRYDTAEAVLREALSTLRERDQRVDSLRTAIRTGIEDLERGDYVEGSTDEILHALTAGQTFERSRG